MTVQPTHQLQVMFQNSIGSFSPAGLLTTVEMNGISTVMVTRLSMVSILIKTQMVYQIGGTKTKVMMELWMSTTLRWVVLSI